MSDSSGAGSSAAGLAGATHWERQTLQKVLMEHIVEQRRARRWGIFFKLLTISLVILFLVLMFSALNKDLPQPVMSGQDHTALIDIRGEIMEEQHASADNIHSALKTAYDNKHVKGLILRINSPGGSPVQARHIYDDIAWFRAKRPNVKIYAVIEDVGASAGYLIATAADAIYADKTSLVGSIGVRMDSFGFVDLMQKVGVERRLYTAGKYKGALDPFSPKVPEEEAFIKEQLNLVHQAFIQNVKQGRGDRLKNDPDIYSGQFWVGERAQELGLIDGFADAYYVAREIVKAEDIIDYTTSTNLLDRLANRIGASVAQTMMRVRFF